MVSHEQSDVTDRAGRARQALLKAASSVPDEYFGRDRGSDWSTARLLRHVVWVEHYWTLLIECAEGSSEPTEMSGEAARAIAVEASRLSGTPPEPLPAPPAYADITDAIDGLKASRAHFLRAVGALNNKRLQAEISTARGAVSVRFAVEHVIEHDWDHAVQISAIGSLT